MDEPHHTPRPADGLFPGRGPLARRAGTSLLLGCAMLLLAGCVGNPLLVQRSSCPALGIPAHTGSLTRFDPAQSRDAAAIRYTAQLSALTGVCSESADMLVTDTRFTVSATRRAAGPAEEVYLPLFVSLVQGGNVLVSKQLTGVLLRFEDGKLRAEASGAARAEVARSAVTLPADVRERITRTRRPDDPDALVDPLADPMVRASIRAASFELLVGFQLDDPSLAYNVGK